MGVRYKVMYSRFLLGDSGVLLSNDAMEEL